MNILSVFFLAVLGLVQSELVFNDCGSIKKFVDGHNSRRLLLAQGKVNGQPAATKMKYMLWDKELAATAAEWASQNDYGHNPDSTIASKRFTTGQNIFIEETTDPDSVFNLSMALDAWYNEHQDYEYKKVESSESDGPVTGHYTQMVWSNTIYVGCAVSQFTEDDWYSSYVVCDYGPAGNVVGLTPYPSGTASGKLTCGANSCSNLYGDSC